MEEDIVLKENLKAEDFADFREDLITDEQRAKLHENQVPGLDDEVDLNVEPIYIPKGTLYKDSYLAPDVPRDSYLRDLHREATRTSYLNYSKLQMSDFVHIDRALSIDFYLNDMLEILKIFKRYYGKGTLYIINGFRSPHEVGVTPHSVGVALDIEAKDRAEARKIMNAAYLAGIPTIIPNGEFFRGEGYVHLDIAPKANYVYDGGKFDGPWSG